MEAEKIGIQQNNLKYKLSYLLLMCMYGCMGPVVRGIDMPSTVVAWLRACIAVVALLLFILFSGKRYSRAEIKKQLKPMLVSGAVLCLDWGGLFASYHYTTIATATLCYYMTSVFTVIGAAVLLREKLTVRMLFCIAVALLGMFFVSGVAENGLPALSEIRGILLALVGAVGYSGVVLINKRYPEGDPLLRTTIQLSSTAIVMTPFILLTTDRSAIHITPYGIAMLLILALGITAAAYVAFFALIVRIPSGTVALFSYADPVVAVLISIFFLNEPISFGGILGAVLIIGAAIVSELPAQNKE